MSSKPWDIYAEQLFPTGYGYPLWIPEPTASGREVFVGDVGCLHEGSFKPLFSSMKAPEDPFNSSRGVPRDFVVFNPRNLMTQTYNKITEGLIRSRSIHSVKAQAGVGVE